MVNRIAQYTILSSAYDHLTLYATKSVSKTTKQQASEPCKRIKLV
jgi:hypothetical protein